MSAAKWRNVIIIQQVPFVLITFGSALMLTLTLPLQFIAEDGKVRNSFTQMITLRDGSSANLPVINYEIICTLGVLTGTYSLSLRPKFDRKIGSDASIGRLDVCMLSYTDSSFSTQSENLKVMQ